jgi:hypothetical protein
LFFVLQDIKQKGKKKLTSIQPKTKDGGNLEMGRKKKSKGSFLLRPFLSSWNILHLPSTTSSSTHPPTHLPSSSHLVSPLHSTALIPPPPVSKVL